ncbi:IspD/TarI family cytidylyltransferase [Alicyclobacillus ferrooxydans]|uniref:2-C-methyl-D-erythritol 4-phosphate cytidylyltransferase n=1 Tax=Alicyclobacillus ferrooxydans TaxID=471514 RepID=A0A0N8PPF7_9BACL|nr:IspD/TarI family cytidylyltransferase [Alicyclobacillus ferrooxydans]KPV44197.1 hypothetical protein AN477_08905 [Alicyclobacillus ferrooxydans]
MVYGVLLAAGSGSRFGEKKQYRQLAGLPVWRRSFDALIDAGVDEVWLVVPKEDEPDMVREAADLNGVHIVVGGASRSESVQAALRSIGKGASVPGDTECVVIHDAARPFVSPKDVQAVIRDASQTGAALLGHACTDTVKRIAGLSLVDETIPRETLILAETPQVFWWAWMRDVYLAASSDMLALATDDAWLMEQSGKSVKVTLSTEANMKITRQTDWEYAEWLAQRRWGGGM